MKRILGILILWLPILVGAQEQKTDYKEIVSLSATSVKNQNNTGTCWSFATTSFLESELLRTGKGEFDLSEMFFVRNAYLQKAKKYLMYHGNANFSEGGQAHDVLNVVKSKGAITEDVYPGNLYNPGVHDHGDMVKQLQKLILKSNKSFDKDNPQAWEEPFTKVLDSYLGEPVEQFSLNGQSYNTKNFLSELGITPEDYIEFTSYQHHPYYKKINLEIPDNWSHDLYYNVPIDDLVEIMDSALYRGFSVCWDGDTSEKSFKHRAGTATLDKEINFDQEARQTTFVNRRTTDDHLMHITGICQDSTGINSYTVKNSWGVEKNPYMGYLYMSEPYVRLKTVAILVHKNAIPSHILKKLK